MYVSLDVQSAFVHTWIPYKMNNQIIKYTTQAVSNVPAIQAARTAAQLYTNNKDLINSVAQAAGNAAMKLVKKVANRNSVSSTPATTTIITNTTRRSRRRTNNRAPGAPIAMGSSSMNPRNANDYPVHNVERICEIGASEFTGIRRYQINPGLMTTFPWLSNIAGSFDRYMFKRLVFRYKPTCPTTTTGQVVFAWDYDALDPTPRNNREMCQETFWKAISPWQSASFAIPGVNKNLFTRNSVIAGSDLKTYDIGQLFISVELDADAVGYIEAEYDVVLKDKQPDFISEAPRSNTSLYLAGRDSGSVTVNGGEEGQLAIQNFTSKSFNWDSAPIALSSGYGLRIDPGLYKVYSNFISGTSGGVYNTLKDGLFTVRICHYDADLSKYVMDTSADGLLLQMHVNAFGLLEVTEPIVAALLIKNNNSNSQTFYGINLIFEAV